MSAYVQKHPEDPLGYYELAQLSWRDHPREALDQLTQAVRLDPGFAAAHVNRAWLLNRLGRAGEALPDLEEGDRYQCTGCPGARPAWTHLQLS